MPLRSNRMSSLSATYRKHENIKKRAYEQRVREVEHSSFTPIVMSLTGGLGNAATTCYKRLATLLSAKHDQHYSTTMSWLRCRLSFSLLRSSIMCIRGTGARSSQGHPIKLDVLPMDLVTTESNLPTSPKQAPEL